MKTTDTEEVDFLTLKEVKFLLNLSSATVRTWRLGSSERDKLPIVSDRIEGRKRVFVYRNDLVDYLMKYRPDLLDRMKIGN